MIFDVKKFSRKYALIYTGIIAVLLILPLVTYIIILLQVDRAKAELSLERHAQKIIFSMQHYQNNEEVFHFPRFQEYDAALYDKNYQSLFSTLQFTPVQFTNGFHRQGDYYYFMYEFHDDYFFGASYLLVAKHYTANQVYFMAFSVFSLILIVLFVLSLLLLKNFSAPFEEMNHHLDNFIKDSMHEINTPLSIINLNVDLHAHKHGENKYLRRIKAASKTLAAIYSDMDYLVKQGRVDFKTKEIEMGDFIRNRVDYFQEVANMKHVVLSTDIEADIFYRFSTKKLQRIVDNTISNAIKYSHDSSIVKVTLHAERGEIHFMVEDEGVGIENTEKIFSRYYRENESKGGFGIGLNIVKQIIDEEGIALNISSRVNEGTTFHYIFYK